MINTEPRPGNHGQKETSAWHGLSELHRVAMSTGNDVRNLLLKGADYTAMNNYGETALHYACQSGNWGGVFQLLLFGADLYHVDKGGRMCIHHAARSGCLLTMQYLEFLGLSPWQRDYRGRTSLHVAVEHGHLELIKYLISKENADPQVRDSKLRTPMHNAVLQNNRSLCWLLESSSKESLLDDKDQEGKTPIDHAMAIGDNLQLLKSLRRWQKFRKTHGNKLTVPRISWVAPFLTPPASTLCVAFIMWFISSRVLTTVLCTIVLVFAYFFAMRPHRLYHVSREANPGLAGWFFGSVITSLVIYFCIILPNIWPDYLFTILSVLMLVSFVKSVKKVYTDPGTSTDTKVNADGHPMGIIDVVSARIPSHDYCTRCKTAYPDRTKHCRLCDRCYKGLDHHCLFLMTCVAINNHGSFLVMVVSVMSAQLFYIRGALLYLWSLSQDDQSLSYMSVMGIQPFISVYFFVNLLGLWWTFALVLFQLKVISEGGTTCFLPNGELRTRIDCLHATGTIGELTFAQRLRHLKQFAYFYYFTQSAKTEHDKLEII